LIEVASGSHLWAERYDRDLDQIFEIQDEVVHAIAVAIPGQIERSRYDIVRSKRPENLTAYDYVLRGRWHWWHATPDHQELIDLFKKAVEIDPNCAPAHVGLARQYTFGVLALGLDPEEAHAKARYHLERALAIDDNDATTHAAAAGAYLQCGEYNLAAIHSRRAFLLNPNDTSVISTYGATLAYLGDPTSGTKVLLESRHMLPHAPDDYPLELLFDCYYMGGDFAKAIDTFRQIRNPVHYMHAEYGAALAQLGRIQEAEEALATSQQHAPAGWRLVSFALNHSRCCKEKEHAELWLEGYRKAGIAV
jgi:tetratricopeptide (TPR) repeat protein